MNRRDTVIAVLALVTVPPGLLAQQPPKVWRIGLLSGASRQAISTSGVYDAFIQRMRELGYVEGKNIAFEWRFAEGRFERFPGFAAEMVRLRVDAIVAGTPPAILPAKQATSTIPIIMLISYDPVGSGFVESLARPGGNITGLSATTEINVKHLDLLRTLIPKLSRVAVLMNSDNPGHPMALNAVESTAAKFRIGILPVGVRTAEEIEHGFEKMRRERANALIVVTDGLFLLHRQKIADAALSIRLPSIVGYREMAEAGALMSYGQPLAEFYRQTANYVDRILKGSNPANLAIEQPTKFEMVINGKTAKSLGLSIPRELLLRADQVIE